MTEQKPSVAVVEPFSKDYKKLERMLHRYGYDVDWFENAKDALYYLSLLEYDCIIQELSLPPGPKIRDAKLQRVWDDVESINPIFPQYWKLGLHILERTKEVGSLNEFTPLIVFTKHKLTDIMYEDIPRMASQRRGADIFFEKNYLTAADVVIEVYNQINTKQIRELMKAEYQ